MRKLKTWLAFLLPAVVGLQAASAGELPPIPVWPHLPVPANQRTNHTYWTSHHKLHIRAPIHWPTLQPFLPAAKEANGCAIIICPGGAYVEESITLEGYSEAKWFNRVGVSCFVLKYRLPEGKLPPGGVPWPLQDVRRAVQIVRAHAAEWHIDPQRVGVMGFSAGGSVASLSGVHWLPGNPNAADPLNRFSTRPDFLVLGYPVISMMPGITHELSHDRLVGKHAPMIVDQYFSSDLNVNALTPPSFVFYAQDDKTVKHQNEKRFCEALKRNGVPVKLLEFKHGGHGFGLGVPGTGSTAWPEECVEWLATKGFFGSSAPANKSGGQ